MMMVLLYQQIYCLSPYKHVYQLVQVIFGYCAFAVCSCSRSFKNGSAFVGLTVTDANGNYSFCYLVDDMCIVIKILSPEFPFSANGLLKAIINGGQHRTDNNFISRLFGRPQPLFLLLPRLPFHRHRQL